MFRCHSILILFLVLLAYAVKANSNVSLLEEDTVNQRSLVLLFDRDLSAYAGANLVLSVADAYDYTTSYVLENFLQAYRKNSLMRIGALFLDYSVVSYLSTFQHELFGHAYILRKNNIDYDWHVGVNSGYVSYMSDDVYAIAQQEALYLSLAGIESEQILADVLTKKILGHGGVNTADYLLYVSTKSLWNYANSTSSIASQNSEGNDIVGYVTDINKLYGTDVISIQDVKDASQLSLLDPLMWFSLYQVYTNINTYENTKIPLFHFDRFSYLPSVRAILTPFGIETKVMNYFISKDWLTKLSITSGKTGNHASKAIQLEIDGIALTNKLSIDLGIYIWQQPELDLESDSSVAINYNQTAVSKSGFLLSSTAYYAVNQSMQAIVELGYKKQGFVAGYDLDAGFYTRLGVDYNW